MLLGERGKGPEKGEAPSGRKQEGGKETGVLAVESGALASSHTAQLQITEKWE